MEWSDIIENCTRDQRPGEMNTKLEKAMSGHCCWHNLIGGKIEETDVGQDSGTFCIASLPFESQEAPARLEGHEYRRAVCRTSAEGAAGVQ